MISDVIHNDIILDNNMLKIIDTPIFQRLARVKQLTSTEFVFPNANHTRKEHSLGAMHLASKYAIVLQLSPYETMVVKVAGLLHVLKEKMI